ncbi:MAG: 50S ribosomal protein L23 [bacterium]|nr:50S ribosomal protein L23 [bacterium]
MKTGFDIIVQPIITERSDKDKKKGKYFFLVRKEATKIDIKKAVEKIFKVNVTKVNIINNKGKTRKRGFRFTYKEPDSKKAIVTLKEGQTIEFFEGV